MWSNKRFAFYVLPEDIVKAMIALIPYTYFMASIRQGYFTVALWVPIVVNLLLLVVIAMCFLHSAEHVMLMHYIKKRLNYLRKELGVITLENHNYECFFHNYDVCKKIVHALLEENLEAQIRHDVRKAIELKNKIVEDKQKMLSKIRKELSNGDGDTNC